MIVGFACLLGLGLLIGYVATAALSTRGWSPLIAAPVGVAVSGAAMAAVFAFAVNYLRDTALSFVQLYLPMVTDRLIQLFTIYQEARG